MDYRAEIGAMVERVKHWPAEDLIALANQILRDMRPEQLSPAPRQTLRDALGVARGEGVVPTDQQVKQWLEEERWQKFGR